jgi:hypothetical protein
VLKNHVKTGLSFSLIAGTLLVPLTALAALWLTNPDSATTETSTTTIAPPETTVAAQQATTTADAAATDLQIACGPEGLQLVSLEKSGTITEVQQGALDALREVCEQQGLPLPAKPAAEPIIRTVVVPAMTGSSTATTGLTAFDDDDHRDHEEDDEHEEDEEHEEDDR